MNFFRLFFNARFVSSVALTNFISIGCLGDELLVRFDQSWDFDLVAIHKLQAAGRLPVPLLFINGELVDLVDGESAIELQGGIDAVQEITIGVPQFSERPLYTYVLTEGGDGAIEAVGTFPEISIEKLRENNGLTESVIAIREIHSSSADVVEIRDGVYELELPSEPFGTLVQYIISSDQSGSVPIRVYHWNGEVFLQPATDVWGESATVIAKAIYESGSPGVYSANIDPEWIQYASFLGIEAPRALAISSDPDQARIYVQGVLHSSTTNSIIQVKESMWEMILIKRDGFAPCQVRSDEVKEPSSDSGVAAFLCQLTPQ